MSLELAALADADAIITRALNSLYIGIPGFPPRIPDDALRQEACRRLIGARDYIRGQVRAHFR